MSNLRKSSFDRMSYKNCQNHFVYNLAVRELVFHYSDGFTYDEFLQWNYRSFLRRLVVRAMKELYSSSYGGTL